MLRQITTKRIAAVRSFSVTRPAAANGGKDSFKEREAASEAAYVKKHEAEQLKELKEKLAEQKKTVQNLEKELKNLKK
ncbi:hypothetical protein JCM33374_g2537 [Metschnikowia sp. JCM 33374]|nr:hypothetical protein JCM33374_g2537 [Metschnikowia sp. JCM 33374]